MKAFILAVLLLGAVPVQAQDTVFRASMVAAVVAHSMDLSTTMHCVGAGKCSETNPLLLHLSTQPMAFAAVKMGVASAQLWAMAKLHERHPRWATAINFGTAGLFTGIAIRNARISK